jgi:hypothetical protein
VLEMALAFEPSIYVPPRAKILKVRWSHHIKARGKMSQMFAFGLQPVLAERERRTYPCDAEAVKHRHVLLGAETVTECSCRRNLRLL